MSESKFSRWSIPWLSARVSLLVVGMLWMLVARADAANVSITHLRCENLLDPLGIDVTKPRRAIPMQC
jgi:hypothetical protein